jgi:hypothetical protein
MNAAAITDAIARLMSIAQRDTGQSRRVADFLLAWHNAEANGKWDPTDMWAVDEQIANDMMTVLAAIRRMHGAYPRELGFEREIKRVWALWRPDQAKRAEAERAQFGFTPEDHEH